MLATNHKVGNDSTSGNKMGTLWVIKRDGRKEPFTPSKLNGWGEWAASTLGDTVDWTTVVLETVSSLGSEPTTVFLQEQLIKTCLQFDSWSYNRMAGRLYVTLMRKNIYGSKMPTVKALHQKLQKLGYMEHLDYSDEEYAEVEGIINHDKDLTYAHYQLHTQLTKYAICDRVNGVQYETPQYMYMRMAMALAVDQPKERRMSDLKAFYEHLSNNRINAPTPNHVNLGTPLRGYASCCLYTTKDTARSIAVGNHIANTMTYMSAGIGSHMNIRSINDPVRGGVIRHMGKLPYYRAVVGEVKSNLQNGRGGACTSYFPVFDPEVDTLLRLKNPMSTEDKKIRGMDYSWGGNKLFAKKVAKNEYIFLFNSHTAPDLYDALYSSDEEKFETLYEQYEKDPNFPKIYANARELFITANNEWNETGRIYEHNIFEMNHHTPFKEKIYSSNLCVAPETRILTDAGYLPIGSLEGQHVNIWNGSQWSATVVVKTGINQELLRVETDSGPLLDCTPYHKFYVFDGYGKPYVEKRAYELNPGDKLAKFDLPVINHGDKILPKAYQNGFYTGDGTLTRQGQRIYLYGEKKSLKDILGKEKQWTYNESCDRIHAHYNDLKDKFFVPGPEYTISSRLEWLAGWLDADGCIYRNGSNEAITAVSNNLPFLHEVQMLLQEISITSKITPASEEGYQKLPMNDGSGAYGGFWCKKAWRLLISSYESYKLLSLGLMLNRLSISLREPQRNANRFIKVSSVTDYGRLDDTYCVNEPINHTAMFNGILTGQCQEIALPTIGYDSIMDLYSEEDHGRGEVAMCNLAGICVDNIESEEQYAEVAYYALLMVDKCIHLAHYELPHIGVTSKARMNAGVGILGLAHAMAKNGLKYTEESGKQFIHETAERHYYYLLQASLQLGKELGNAPWMHKTKWPEGYLPIDTHNKNVDSIAEFTYHYDWETLRYDIIANGGIRNSVLVAHMPTETSANASGTTNGLYPIRELTMIKTDNARVNYWAAPDSDTLSDKYESAWDIPMKDLTDMYAIMQKFTDQGISADFYRKVIGDTLIPSSDMIKNYLYRVKMGLKGKYYMNQKTSNGLKSESNTPDNVVTLSFDETGECSSGACTL